MEMNGMTESMFAFPVAEALLGLTTIGNCDRLGLAIGAPAYWKPTWAVPNAQPTPSAKRLVGFALASVVSWAGLTAVGQVLPTARFRAAASAEIGPPNSEGEGPARPTQSTQTRTRSPSSGQNGDSGPP